MSEAIKRIVGAYVELRNRKALEDRKAHRYRLITELKSMKGAFDLSSPIKQLEDDMAVIDCRPCAARYTDRGLGAGARSRPSFPGVIAKSRVGSSSGRDGKVTRG